MGKKVPKLDKLRKALVRLLASFKWVTGKKFRGDPVFFSNLDTGIFELN
jgi:hypothetical protein